MHRFKSLFSCAALAGCMLLAGADAPLRAAQPGADVKLPEYALDTSWPKLPLPHDWALGLINGIWIDKDNNVWVYHTPEGLNARLTGAASNPPTAKCCVPAPAIIEFSQSGEVLRAWGDPTKPGEGFDWPTAGHGIYVDYKGNVWIGGSATRAARDDKPADGQYLKFDQNGKLLLKIGGKGPSKGSNDPTILSGASAVDVDPASNEAFISDGYGNKRVIVFDADSGEFKRQWGAYGHTPSDEKHPRYNGSGELPQQFNLVHGIRIAKDGKVYVTDRLNNRIQVFTRDGRFLAEQFYEPATGGSGSVGNVSFWPSAKQEIFVLNDPGNFQWVLVRRADLKELARFGHYGTYGGEFTSNHQMEFDLKGNIYTSEDFRVQKFKVVNAVRPR